METLAEKLHPKNFTAMSGKMSALVAFILGETWTELPITDVHITSDGHVLAQITGDVGLNYHIGTANDFLGNIFRLLDAAELSKEEKRLFMRRYVQRITDHRPSFSVV